VCEGPPFPEEIVNGKEICRQFFQGRLGLLGSQTNHLIRLRTGIGLADLFDDSYVHADIELWVRLLKDGGRFGFVHDVLTFTRIHAEAASEISHLVGSGGIEFLAILMKYGGSFLSERERRLLLREYRRRQIRFRIRAFAKAWDRRPWQYQITRSQELGIHFGVLEIVRAGLLELFVGALSPLEFARRVGRSYQCAKNIG
jgi:hypothetical protein